MSDQRYGHMVQEYYVHRMRELVGRRRTVLGAVSAKGAAEAYVRRVRRIVREAFGPEPERTPLKAQVTGARNYGRFSIERISFESRPGLMVTGNLYLPSDLSGRAPAVLGLCGHAQSGKAEEKYRAFCQGLATKGFVTLIIDPISQGERVQFTSADGDSLPGLCEGHNVIGNQQVLLDDFFGSWRVWDAVRGLDYLLERPEVDTSRVGVTGNSGGGTLSSYLTALDPRITMAAPSCYICSYLANLENEIPADAEQNPPGILTSAFDQADLLLCYAPRPTLILSQIDGFFDERYARASFEDVRRIHEMLGSRDTVEYYAGPHGHGFHQENREAMYAFFMKHAGIDGAPGEPKLIDTPAEELSVTPSGDTGTAGSRRVFDFIRDTGAALAKSSRRPSASELVDLCRDLLSVPPPDRSPHYRNLSRYRNSAPGLLQRSQFAVETEPGIQTIVTTYGAAHRSMHPPEGPIIAYVGHTDARADIENVSEVRALIDETSHLVTIDPRGFGPSTAATCNSHGFFAPYGSDYLYASTGEMLGESYLGRRVLDVVRSLDFLADKGATEITLMGRGLGSVIVAFAAILEPAIAQVRLLNYLPSFRSLTEDPLAVWPLSSLPRGVLRTFDLPDLYAALEDRLELSAPWNARMDDQ